MSFTVIIPARYTSTRLPAKALLDIAGKPLIQHVYEKAVTSQAHTVIIATDDKRIEQASLAFGAMVCMTSENHRSGTERIKEVIDLKNIPSDEIIVNVQGDEPMLPAENINQVAQLLEQNVGYSVATLYSEINELSEIFNPNAVKLVKDKNNCALYFSRAPIPWDRDQFGTDASSNTEKIKLNDPYYRHVGIYAYRAEFLSRYTQWKKTKLEVTESLEQLRILENGEKIIVSRTIKDPGIGVDTQEDLDAVRKMLNHFPT